MSSCWKAATRLLVKLIDIMKYNGDHKIKHHNIIPQLTCAFVADSVDQQQLEGAQSNTNIIVALSSSSWTIQPAGMVLYYILVVGRDCKTTYKQQGEGNSLHHVLHGHHSSCPPSHCLEILCQHFDIATTIIDD